MLQGWADRAWDLYDRLLLRRPRASLLAFAALFAFSSWFIKDFRLDASGDSLVLEHDEDVKYYGAMSNRFESGDFVVITYTPPDNLFSPESLDALKRIREELKRVPRVSSVVTPLDVPLLRNPPGTLKDLKKNIKTLESPKAKLSLAIEEFRTSPIYQKLIVGEDMKSAAIQVNFMVEKSDKELVSRRAFLREKDYRSALSLSERDELKGLEARYRAYKDAVRARRHEDIAAIRAIIRGHSGQADFLLGGVPMIVDDIMSFIQSDLRFFGTGMVVFLILTLALIYRRCRWVILPVVSCVLSVLFMVGGMGLIRWDDTIVSSNFVSLQLILTMSLAIHIVSRYRELMRKKPGADSHDLVLESTRSTFVPCLYCNLTTMAGFSSLILCDILPVTQFGWMMTLGLGVSMVVVFWLMPACMMLLPKPPADVESEFGLPAVMYFAHIADKHRNWVYSLTALGALATVLGIYKLTVENSFIDYFRKSTDIYQGMKFIDDKFGGTTPLDIIVKLPTPKAEPAAPAHKAKDKDFDLFEEFEEPQADTTKYWYTTERMAVIERVHDYLDSLPETGKVMSLATLYKTSRSMNEGKPFDDFSLALLYNTAAADFKDFLVTPYVSVENDEARLTTRIKDSMQGLKRDLLIKRIRRDLVDKAGLKEGQFRISGLMLLYNNLLQSLYSSQIKTIFLTALTLMAMFLLLFRSIRVTLAAIIPQLLASMSILGVMGLSGTPLDVMTITIVSISVGIAVDDTIHYLHRFKMEFPKDQDYVQTMVRCHTSVGNAMLYTSIAITIGFSILTFSNFIPTALFGALTGLAMVVACITSQTLLPVLIMLFKAFGPGKD